MSSRPPRARDCSAGEVIMNQDYPHDIRRFADGESIPDGYLELTEEEFKLLDPMTSAQRAEWFQEFGREDELTYVINARDEVSPLLDRLLGLERKGAPEDLERRVMQDLSRVETRRDRNAVISGEDYARATPKQMRRFHRRQSR